MFFKLARKNVTRSLKDYSVYFLTLTLGVSLFYVFNSLEGSGRCRCWPKAPTIWWNPSSSS